MIYREKNISTLNSSPPHSLTSTPLLSCLFLSYQKKGRWLDLCPKEEVCERDGDPVSSLDVQILFERLLRPVLGIECPRTDHRMIYVCGSEGAAGLENQVREETNPQI